MNAHEIHALSGAYAVDALDDVERHLFETHLGSCETCQSEVDSIRHAAILLGELATATPPPALKTRIMADISQVRPLPPTASVVTVLAERRTARWGRFLAAAATVAAVTGGVVAVGSLNEDSSTQRPVLSAAQQVIQARDARHVSVDLPGGASATVYRSLALNEAAILTRKMPAAPKGRVYQLWLTRDGDMIPAGTMTGGGSTALVLKGSVIGTDGAGITIEPKGGSKTPSSAPIATFDFEKAT